MKLYLVQHGNSLSKDEDPECPLSVQGEQDVASVAHFLASAGVKVGKIFHSGKKRAEQTANILSNTIGTNTIKHMEGIKPMNDVLPIIHQIKEFHDDVMLVGHMPFMSRFISQLFGKSEDEPVVNYEQGSIVCLERDENGHFAINWMVRPELF